jgi:hypothetical protein
MADFKRIGRNNKNRGRAFERHVADFLGWTRVPYSGAQKDWGGGDVIDGFYTKDGFWTAECKTQKARPDNAILIKAKWIGQMLSAATPERRPIIIVKTVAAKLNEALVVMDDDTFDWFRMKVDHAFEKLIANGGTQLTRGKGHNFVIPQAEQRYAISGNPVHLPVLDRTSNEQTNWFFYRLDAFKTYIDAAGLYRPKE